MSAAETSTPPAPVSPVALAAGVNDDQIDAEQPSGRGSPDSAASDATPVTKNAAPPKKKKNNLHSMWETKTTSWKGPDTPVAPPTTVRTSTTAWPKPAPKVSPAASATSSATSSPMPPPVNKPPALGAASVSSSPKTPPRDAEVLKKHNVKKEAKKFEVSKKEAEDELAVLKRELEALQGKPEEPIKKKESTPPRKKKKNVHSFWEQKTKDAEPLAVSKTVPFNQTASYTKSPPETKGKKLAESEDDGATSEADPKIFAEAVTVAAAATAITATVATEDTPKPAPQAAPPAAPEEGSLASVDKSFDNDSITSGDTVQLMSEFRTLVEKLVRKSMPSEIDHIDELIEEYDGREEELLGILSAMHEEGDQEEASEEDGSAAVVATVAGVATIATAAAVAGSQDQKFGLENITSFESDMHVYEDDETAPSFETADRQKNVGVANVQSEDTIHTSTKSVNTNSAEEDEDADKNADDLDVETLSKGEYDSVVSKTTADIGNVIVTSPEPERGNSDIEKGEAAAAALEKSEIEPCWKRNKMTLLTLAIIAILAGAGAAIGIILSSPPGGNKNNIKVVVFDEPIGSGRPLPESQGDLSPGVSPDDIDTPSTTEENLSTSCASESSYSELPLQPGIEQLKGENPLVAVDGTNAVIVTGSGYVSFYSLQGTNWQRGETFGILASNGDIAAVSISGNTAVIGLPKAAVAVGSSGPIVTGTAVTYERNPESGTWRQAKMLVPNEYEGGALRYQKSLFGQSVSLYDDLLVVGAPSEQTDQGSATVFKKNEKGLWDQVIKLARGAGICQNTDDIFFGYYVNVYKNMIAASADCAENIVLYEYDRTDGSVKSSQVLEWIDRKFGAVASVGMSGEYLIYSTTMGGLFIFRSQGDSEFVLSQDLTFNNKLALFEYPVVISGNLFALAVDNKLYLYTQAEQDGEWKRESVILKTDGEFDGYVKAGLGVSNGHVFLGSNTNIEPYDFSQCVPELVIPEVVIPESNCVVVNVTLDTYPTDTTWKFEDSDGNTVASNTPYNEYMSATTQVEEVCDLSDGDYSFTIFDDYEDGICCSWGVGSYTLSTKSGLRIASGGEFGASDKTSFSMPFAGYSVGTKPTPVPTTPAPTKQPTPAPATPAPVQPTCTTIEISVSLDDYPQDTSWNVTDSIGGVVAKSPAYDASMAGSTQVESVCLLAGTYSFDIYDDYEDGICCSWGQGSYTLTSEDGGILATGGEWLGPSDTKTFQLT